MSSKLHRGGGIDADPISWHSVTPMDPSPAGTAHAGVYTPPPAGSRGSPFAPDHEQQSRAAYQQGLQEGQAAARQEAAAQLDAMNGRLARAIEELAGLKARFRHEAEEDVVALSIAIARRILHRELTVSPDALLGLVKAALEKIELREVHRVRVRPEDGPMVGQHLERMGLPHRIEVISDPGLDRGAVVLESSRGALDVSVETQLAEIERGFADLVRRV